MRLVNAEIDGQRVLGRLQGEQVVELSSTGIGSVDEVVRRSAYDQVEGARGTAHALSAVSLLPPVLEPAKVLCTGVNYLDHRVEAQRGEIHYPTIFSRYADSHVGAGHPIIRPRESERFDFEGELAVIIGTAGRRITEEQAWSHIAGYSCYNDGSVRDWQRHGTQWLPGKNFIGSGAFGPALVTPDEVDDIAHVVVTTHVNGELMQSAPISDLLFGIPALIAYVSTFTILQPGDVLLTGTPGGVGAFRTPPVFLQPGDLVTVAASGVGSLTNRVVAEA